VKLTPFPESQLLGNPDWHTIAAEVDAHSDLTYVGGDLGDIREREVIVLYTKPGSVHKTVSNEKGRLIALTDGHPELILDQDLPDIFNRSNAARAKHGLPPLVMDGSAPVAASGPASTAGAARP
jgi:hypothetical protein